MEKKKVNELLNLDIELSKILKECDPSNELETWYKSYPRENFTKTKLGSKYPIYQNYINLLKKRLNNIFKHYIDFDEKPLEDILQSISMYYEVFLKAYFQKKPVLTPNAFLDGLFRSVSMGDNWTKKWKYTLGSLNSTDKSLKGDFELSLWSSTWSYIEYKWIKENIENWKFEFSSDWTLQKINIQNYSNKKVSFQKIEINDFKEFDSIVFRWVKIDKLIIKNLDNTSNFIITNCNIINLQISDSDLGKMKFNGVEIAKLTIENTTLNDSVFNGVDFGSYKLWKSIYWKAINKKKLKDNYRQLKFVMEKNGNHTEANKFYEKEMESYKDILEKGDFSIWKTLKILHENAFLWKDAKNASQVIPLKFSYFVNNFWNNWLRAWFLILLFAIIATLLDGLSSMFYSGIKWDQIAIAICILIIYMDYRKRTLFNKFWDKLDSIFNNLFYFILYFCLLYLLFI